MAEHFENTFARAAARGNVRVMKQMLKKGVDVNRYESDGRTPLILALENGRDEVVRLLVEAGVDVNRYVIYNKTPLILALENGRDEVVRLLIEAGANVNEGRDSNDKTPLIRVLEYAHDRAMRAPAETETDDLTRTVQTCKPDAVKLLIQAGADVNNNGYSGPRPLWCAVRYNCVQCLSLLIESGADVNKHFYGRDAPLWYAVEHNYVQCVSLLIEAGAHVKIWEVQDDLLCLASREGHDPCLNLLLQAIGDDVKQHWSPLRIAVEHDHDQCLNLLIEAMGGKLKEHLELLRLAAKGGRVKCVSLLINAGLNVNGSGALYTPLKLAVENDHIECAASLIKAGADVNYTAPRRRAVLAYARSLAGTSLLLRSGVKINRSFYKPKLEKRAKELLLAAGETCLNLSHSLPEADDLMGMCRDAIRKHLLELDWYTHLFGRVERLGLPAALTSYLLFDQSLDDDFEVEDDEAEAGEN